MTMFAADALKRIMLARETSGRKLAERIGCNEATVSRYLNGKQQPGRGRIQRIAEVLEVDVGELEVPAPSTDDRPVIELTKDEYDVILAMRSMSRLNQVKVWAFAQGLKASGGSPASAVLAAEAAASLEALEHSEPAPAPTPQDARPA